jgi:ATP-dependent helicase/nuclease subunit A
VNALRAEVERATPALADLAAAAKKGKDGAAKARAAAAATLLADVRRFGLPSWKSQFQFAASVDMPSLSHLASELVSLVYGHLEAEAFQADVFAMQARLFDLASSAIDAFAAEKAAARVVDFGDMLALAHRLLARPSVQDALRDRLDLVLVDEFQDTSPIQLAVAAALGSVAKRSIWVGDRKQAIFAFQGSDPDLMSAAIEWALQGKAPDILRKSYRSRPALVGLTSELFARSFAAHHFAEDEVRLEAAHADLPELAAQHAVEVWRWSKEKLVIDGEKVSTTEAHAIAAGVEALLASPPTIRERVDGGPDRLRPASRRDVAVLAFTHEKCRAAASALRARGIPAHVSLKGLAQEPESLLTRAALALLADPSDGVAALEVSWLGGGASGDPDGWLSRRLSEIAAWRKERGAADAANRHGPPQPLAFADDPRVAALRSLEASQLSPAEALDRALRAAAIPELLRTWPDPERRLANIEALRAEARAYEDLCTARHGAATVLGLVQHLSELGEDADQAMPTAEDAVHVSTWHGAKGLEWPIVVLSHLDHERDRDVFDIAVEPAAAFSFADPLAGRWVRYWPWPYGKMSKNLALLDAAMQSPEAERAIGRDGRERLRLLYVGFTRARDLLVVIASVGENDGAAVSALRPLADQDGKPRIALPFEAAVGPAQVRVGEEHWPCVVRQFSGAPYTPNAEPRGMVRWYARGTHVELPPERLNPSSEPHAGPVRVVGVTQLGGRRELTAGADQMSAVGDAIHAFLAADGEHDAERRRAMAARLLAAHGVQGAIDPRTLMDASEALRRWLNERYPGAVWRREWPVRARLGGDPGRLLVGEVDLFLELEDGFVLVDHKSFPGTERDRDRKLQDEWAPQLGWYADALARALGKPLKAAFIHLPIRGEMAQLELTQVVA